MKAQILVVDDNPTNRKLAADVLTWDGCTVQEAQSGVETLALLVHFRPDLILMDISMPGMDGLTLTRKIKSDPQTRSIPIVALTASAMKGDELRASEAGCDGYITKPIDTRRFTQQIAAFLRPESPTAQMVPPPP